jgi:hypothetical protein
MSKRRRLSESDEAFVEACLEEMRDGCTVEVACSPAVSDEIERRWAAEFERRSGASLSRARDAGRSGKGRDAKGRT